MGSFALRTRTRISATICLHSERWAALSIEASPEPPHRQSSLRRARRHDGAADLRDAGTLDGAADRRRHRGRSRHRGGAGRRLSRDRRRSRAFLTTLGCGGFILRYGAVRMTQVGMAGARHRPRHHHGGLAAALCGRRLHRRAGAGGLDTVEFAPARSTCAADTWRRWSSRSSRCGVPVGLMLAGVVAPVLVVEAGWRVALLVIALFCLLIVLALQPLRAALRRRPQSGPAAVAGRHPRQCRRRAARPGAAHAVRRHVQLRRPAVALHRLLRALSGARPGLRPRARRPGLRHRHRRGGAGAHRLGLARLALRAARDPAGLPRRRHGGRCRSHGLDRSRLADLGRRIDRHRASASPA